MKTKTAVALLGLYFMSAADSDAQASIDRYRWAYRPVLVFAPEAADSKLREQKRLIAASGNAVRERDIVVVYVVGGDVSYAFGPAPGAGASALRARYGVAAHDFAAILVGKDGGVKLRSATPLAADRLASVIDAMPMRRDEMGHR